MTGALQSWTVHRFWPTPHANERFRPTARRISRACHTSSSATGKRRRSRPRRRRSPHNYCGRRRWNEALRKGPQRSGEKEPRYRRRPAWGKADYVPACLTPGCGFTRSKLYSFFFLGGASAAPAAQQTILAQILTDEKKKIQGRLAQALKNPRRSHTSAHA